MSKLINISELSKILNLVDPINKKTSKSYFKILGKRI